MAGLDLCIPYPAGELSPSSVSLMNHAPSVSFRKLEDAKFERFTVLPIASATFHFHFHMQRKELARCVCAHMLEQLESRQCTFAFRRTFEAVCAGYTITEQKYAKSHAALNLVAIFKRLRGATQQAEAHSLQADLESGDRIRGPLDEL